MGCENTPSYYWLVGKDAEMPHGPTYIHTAHVYERRLPGLLTFECEHETPHSHRLDEGSYYRLLKHLRLPEEQWAVYNELPEGSQVEAPPTPPATPEPDRGGFLLPLEGDEVQIPDYLDVESIVRGRNQAAMLKGKPCTVI